MKIIHKLLLVLAAACTALPAVRGSVIAADAKEDKGYYPMACSVYEVDLVNDSGGFDKTGCYNDYSSALNAMKQLGDDGVVRHAGSYSQTKIIAMNNGIAFAYPFRGGTSMMYYYQDINFSSSYATTYSGQHYQMKYFDTPVYNGDGTGRVKINLNGFEGYVELRDVDLVPVKFFIGSMSIILGGNETFYNTPEQPYSIIPLMNTYQCAQNGNYKDMLFNSYYGWPDDTGYSMRLDANTALPAASWMNAGTTYYSYNGYDFYTDQGFHNYAGQYYNYYQFLPMRSKTAVSASVYDTFLKERNIASNSKLYGQGQVFIDAQNDYGVNALIVYAMACLESAYGTSYYAQNRNNFFGWGAVDSNPNEAASYSSVEEGIRTQMSTNLAGFLDMNDWRYFGSMLGSKGAGFNLKYASAVYWGIDIASIAYKIDKCSCGNNGSLTDCDTVEIGIVTNPKAEASLTLGGKIAYDITSCNGNYIPLYPVAVLSENGQYLETQCTNYVVDGKLYFIESSADVRTYDWNNSVGWFRADDIEIVNRETESEPEPVIGDPIRTTDSLTVEGSVLTIAGTAYTEGVSTADGNDISIMIRAVDTDYECCDEKTASVQMEGDEKASWSASFDLSSLTDGTYFFNGEYTYALTPEYGSEWYLKFEALPDPFESENRTYALNTDENGFICLEIKTVVRTPEPEEPQESEIAADDALLMRGIETVVYDEENSSVTLRGLAFFTGYDAREGEVTHSLVLVNMETGSETVLEAETDSYDHALAGGDPDYTDVGFTAVLDLLEIETGNYYLRVRTETPERTGEGALFSNLEGIDQSAVNGNGETVRFFANPLSNYRLEVSVEKQTLNLDETEKPSRMTSLFGYQSVKIADDVLTMNGIGIIYGISMQESDNVSYTVWLEDEQGSTYSWNMPAAASGMDFAEVIHNSSPLTYVSFDLHADLSDLPSGTYRVYLEIKTDSAHDMIEAYSLAADTLETVCESGRTYKLATTDVRSRYILRVE